MKWNPKQLIIRIGIFFILMGFSSTLMYFSFLQYNDPDAFLWILIYAVPGVFLFIAAVFPVSLMGKILKWASYVLLLGMILFAVLKRKALFFIYDPFHIEVIREMGGLLIVFIFLFLGKLMLTYYKKIRYENGNSPLYK